MSVDPIQISMETRVMFSNFYGHTRVLYSGPIRYSVLPLNLHPSSSLLLHTIPIQHYRYHTKNQKPKTKTKKAKMTEPTKISISSDYLRAISTQKADLYTRLRKNMTQDLQEFEMRWVSSVNAMGDKMLTGEHVDEDVVALSQIVWDGLKLALKVVELLAKPSAEIFGDGETWELVYIPPFFVENTVFCGRRTGVKFDLPMLQHGGYVIYPTNTGTTAGGRKGGQGGLKAFYNEFLSLVDGIERQSQSREIGLIREELAARMAS
ncbi:hypothetical protein L873DRAFT_1518700 [Choiromyces venosus 120613-1]|uniref:Uncharacterized protein n=1 Tax=Choiromyces venosus 120613-1 TaxID=1336337 RepID=A0A3N4J649_9PEZI|nr:hypothetical protein L873DRAFT_1518700 [Choiromyces venosus 120613-1]